MKNFTFQKYKGWRKVRSKTTQFVSNKNRVERVIYASLCLLHNLKFDSAIFLDECTIQCNSNARTIWYKFFHEETRLGLVPKYKHEYSLHVLGGISRRGRTDLMIFTGKLNAIGFIAHCNEFLLPFIVEHYVDGHSVHMDNAPWHTSNDTIAYIEENDIFWARTPAQSPDFNPIELVWHDLKDFIRSEIMPKCRDELIAGVRFFWEQIVTVEYCNSKIDHLDRVLRRSIQLLGKPTGM